MANVRFSVDCPSCEAEVPVRNSSSIGKKIECPKCKFRFVCPQPPGDDEDDDDDDTPPAKGKKGAKGDKKAKKGKKNEKAGNSKVLVGVLIGVLALAALGAGAYFVLGSGEGGSAKTQGTKPGGNTQPTTPATTPATTPTPDPMMPPMPDPMMPPMPDPMMPPMPDPMMPDPMPPKPKPKPRPNDGQRDITNLLPGNTQSVWYLRFEELLKTPLMTTFFDQPTRDSFRLSMTFDVTDVDRVLQCYVTPERLPFAIIRTKGAIDEARLLSRMNLDRPMDPNIKGRDYFIVKSNPFLTAISRAFNLDTVLGNPTPPPAKKGPENPLAICVYDSRTLVIADKDLMIGYLNDLKDDGFPPFKSDLIRPTPAPPATQPGGTGGPMTQPPMGPGPGPGRGGAGRQAFAPMNGDVENAQAPRPQPMPATGGSDQPPMSGTGAPMPGGGGPGGGGTTPPAGPILSNPATNPTFRTINPPLKRALNELDDDSRDIPAAIFVMAVNQRGVNALDLRTLFPFGSGVALNLLNNVKTLGLSLQKFTRERMLAHAYIEYLTNDEAKRSIKEQITPLVTLSNLLYLPFTGTTLTVRDAANPVDPNDPNQPGGMNPGGEPGGIPGSGPQPGGPGGRPTPGGPGGPGGRPTPGGPAGSGSRGAQMTLPGGDENALLQRPQPPGGGGSGTRPGDGGGPGPIPGGPGGEPGGPGDPMQPMPNDQNSSYIEVRTVDTVVLLSGHFTWQEEKWSSTVLVGINRLFSQLKGRMSVMSGETDWFTLSSAFPKVIRDRGEFPRGTLEREVRAERFGLPFPPEQRVSFLAELLPYLGKASVRSAIDERKFAWYAKENLSAAETWVPEFLNPSYDQSAWRATHEFVPDRTVGATNYVGIAGVGRDAARYNPADPDSAKKLGMIGYDWNSKAADVKDGLSNTIYMMQVPPGLQRPWIAGGGATIVGIDDTGDPFQEFVTRAPDGKRGAYALMGDGSVRWIKEGIDPTTFRALVTRAGGESLSDLDKTAPKLPAPRRDVDSELKTDPGSTIKPAEPATPADPGAIDADELKKFQGEWKIVAITERGVAVPADQLKLIVATITISGTKLTFSAGPKKDSEAITLVNAKSNPKQFGTTDGKDLQGKAKSITLIYEFDGDKKLKFCGPSAGGPTPTKFEATKDTTLMELEKVK